MRNLCSNSAAIALALAVGGLVACAEGESVDLFQSQSHSQVSFALKGMSGEAASASVFEYWVKSRAGKVVAHDRAAAKAGALEVSVPLPPGEGYRVEVDATTGDGRECHGYGEFDVDGGETIEVEVGLECRLPDGRADIVGELHNCPNVSIAAFNATLEVGSSLALSTEGELNPDWNVAWSATGGDLTTHGDGAHFQCTEPGKVELSLSVDGGHCKGEDTAELHCTHAAGGSEHGHGHGGEQSGGGTCGSIATNCYPVRGLSDDTRECHHVGHSGDESTCGTESAACAEACGEGLCEALIAACHDVDPGSGPLHECHELAHAGQARECFERGAECHQLCTEAQEAEGMRPVSIRFEARAGQAPVACGVSDSGGPELTDLRMFVHDVRLLRVDGTEVPVALDDRGSVQTSGVALLDFEDGTGQCLAGDSATNTVVTGFAAAGDYSGVAFRLGVPGDLNHLDPAAQPAPLAAGNLHWSWLSGYRFMRAEMGGAVLHLGSGGCSGDPRTGSVQCARPNRPEIRIQGFDPESDGIAVDLNALLAGQGPEICHSSGAACSAMFAALGLSLTTGQNDGQQSVFRSQAAAEHCSCEEPSGAHASGGHGSGDDDSGDHGSCAHASSDHALEECFCGDAGHSEGPTPHNADAGAPPAHAH